MLDLLFNIGNEHFFFKSNIGHVCFIKYSLARTRIAEAITGKWNSFMAIKSRYFLEKHLQNAYHEFADTRVVFVHPKLVCCEIIRKITCICAATF